MAYEFARYRSVYFDDVLRLQHHLWGSEHELSAAYFRWKYEQNPYLAEPAIYLALDGGQVVAMRAACGTRWQFGVAGSVIDLPSLGDTVVLPEHRGMGLVGRLTDFALDDLSRRGYACAINMTGTYPVYRSAMRSGWQCVMLQKRMSRMGIVRRMLRTLDTYSQAVPQQRAWLRRIWRGARRPATAAGQGRDDTFARLDQHRGAREIGAGGLLTIAREPDPNVMMTIAAETAVEDRLQLKKDGIYFSWAFSDDASDHRFAHYANATSKGYLVLRRPRNGDLGHVIVDDLEFTDTAALSALLGAVAQLGAFPELTVWAGAFTESDRSALRAVGFATPGRRQWDAAMLIRCKCEPDWMPAGLDVSNPEHWRIYKRF